MTHDAPEDPDFDVEDDNKFTLGQVLKPVFLGAAILMLPPATVALTSPIVVPMLFSMSRRDSTDLGWRRAGLVGAGVVAVETALYLMYLVGGL